VVDLGEAALDVGDRGSERRVVDGLGAVARLEQDLLGVVIGKSRVGEDLVRGLRLAAALVLVGDVLGADERAQRHRDDDEGDPAEDRLAAVLRAPASRAGGDALAIHGCSFGSWGMGGLHDPTLLS
jgi:hypothetical protein